MFRSGRKTVLSAAFVLAVFLVLAIISGIVSLINTPAYAAEDSKAIEMVNNGAAAVIKGKQKSNVYFGNYKQSSDGNGGYKVEPIKWRVLQNKDGKVFIMADKLLDARFFDINNYSRGWDLSDVRAWLNGYGDHSVDGFINRALSSDEQESVAITTVTTPINPSYGTGGGEDTQDKIFLLSLPEVIEPEYGFNSDRFVKDDARKGVFTDYSASLPAANSECVWILRTKGNSFGSQVIVHGAGEIDSLSGIGIGISTDPHYYPKPIRPALKIDLGSVLFTSAAVNGKKSGNVGPDAMRVPAVYDGKDWKFTVKDADRKFKVTETEAECTINDILTLNYTDAVTGSNEYISAMITNQAGEILSYGRVKQPESVNGTVDIMIPKSLVTGSYDLKLFNEQYNGDMETDYASEISTVRLTVGDPLVPYVNDAGRKQEPKVCKPIVQNSDTMQTLSSGWYTVLADVEASITVKGDVNLILCDGATLETMVMIDSNSSLTIWAQSMGADKGTLDASLQKISSTGLISSSISMSGIGFTDDGTGKLTINGGNIIAKGLGGAAGIGGRESKPGGNVELKGGRVIAEGTANMGSLKYPRAIGRGAGSASDGMIYFGKVKASIDGGSNYFDSADRISACMVPNTEVLIERCSNHKFENDVCKYCGAGRPVRIDDGNADLQVTLGGQLTYSGKEQTQTVTKITLNGTDITDFCDISGNIKKDAGDYELSVTADKECDYEGTVKKQFTIKQAVPAFTVSAAKVNDDLNVSAAKLSRNDETIPGTLELIETTLSYGTGSYRWKFTPSDQKNYKTLTGTVNITVTGHNWEFAGFEWTGNEQDGYTAVKAKYVCRNNTEHTDTVSKVTLSDDETKPTCADGGKTVYTAAVTDTDSLDGKEHTENKDAKATQKLGHKWGAWTEMNEKQHMRVCENDSSHYEMEAHKWDDGVITKEATSKEYGKKVFTCSVCKAEKTETLPMLKPDDKEADEAKEDETLPVVNVNKANTVGNFRKKQMKIVFPANRKVDNYRIQYKLAGGKKWTNGWSAGTGTYIVRNLKKYTLCEFRIAGYVKQDDGTWIRSKWSKISYRYVSSTPIKTIKAGKKCIKLTWKKEGKSNGYKIQYSLKKNMAGRKTITIKSKSTTKYTIKKLKKGKTYYIRIRPIKKKSGKTYIGILSGTKNAKVK